MNEEMQMKIEELMNDEEYVRYFLSLENAEAMSLELESKDIDLSPEEIRKIGQSMKKRQDGELSEDELENITGGDGGFFDFIPEFFSSICLWKNC